MFVKLEEAEKILEEAAKDGLDYLLVAYEAGTPDDGTAFRSGKLQFQIEDESFMEDSLFRLCSNNPFFGTILMKTARRLGHADANASQN